MALEKKEVIRRCDEMNSKAELTRLREASQKYKEEKRNLFRTYNEKSVYWSDF